jgi:hypothetical protein
MRSFGVFSFALTLTSLLLLASNASGQSGSVVVGGRVGEAIFVSIAPDVELAHETLPITYSNLDKQTVRLSIHISNSVDVKQIHIPLHLRSNVGYTLSATANPSGTTLRGLCVRNVRATGRYVASGAVNAGNAASCGDETGGVQRRQVKRSGALHASSPAELLTGQSISLSGTSDSPFNALEVMLQVEVELDAGQSHGSIELILSASPAGRVSAATIDAR